MRISVMESIHPSTYEILPFSKSDWLVFLIKYESRVVEVEAVSADGRVSRISDARCSGEVIGGRFRRQAVQIVTGQCKSVQYAMRGLYPDSETVRSPRVERNDACTPSQ